MLPTIAYIILPALVAVTLDVPIMYVGYLYVVDKYGQSAVAPGMLIMLMGAALGYMARRINKQVVERGD